MSSGIEMFAAVNVPGSRLSLWEMMPLPVLSDAVPALFSLIEATCY
jgi:hypothetical protein